MLFKPTTVLYANFCAVYIKIFLISLLVLNAVYSLQAQTKETIIVGDVFDKYTQMPIENANIYFKKQTEIGTASNSEGFFMLRTSQEHSDIVIVSALGYKAQSFKVAVGQYAGVHIELIEETATLQDVFVLPGSNPALALMEQVRKARTINNTRILSFLEEERTEETNLFISNISHKTLQRRMWKSLKSGVVHAEDSSLLIPLYTTRKKYLYIGQSKELLKVEDENSVTLAEKDFEFLLESLETDFDFYKNTLTVFGRNFISPLASAGNSYYKYYLADSLSNGEQKSYVIQFKSKNTKNLAFQGEFMIDSATYALQSIQASIPEQSNLNFLSSLHITQHYSKHDDYFTLQNEQISVLFDFAVSLDTIRHFPTLFVTRNMIVEDNHMRLDLDRKEKVEFITSETISEAMDSLSHTPLMKIATFAAQTIFTGYAPAGYIDIGKVVQIIALNQPEKIRLGIPIRTSENLMKNICFEAYGAYGFRDKAWKYMAQLQYSLPAMQRQQFNISYTDDYIRSEFNNFDMLVRENTIARGFMDLTSSLLAVSPQYNLARRTETRFWINNDWTSNIETTIDVRSGKLSYGNPMYAYYTSPNFHYNSIGITGRWSWNERVVDTFFKRIYIYNYFPVLYLNIEGGNFRMNNAEHYQNYAKFNLMVRQNISVGMVGEISYLLQAGWIFGAVPYPLLQAMHGNESLGYDRYKFSLMNNLEFVTDKYLSLHTDWNMGGVLFNQIPGVKRLNLREVISFKAAYGGMRSAHVNILSLPDGTGTFLHPYLEASVGIANILRILSIQSVWRITERNKPNANLWGIKLQIMLGL